MHRVIASIFCLAFAACGFAETLQDRIDRAAPGATIVVEGIHRGARITVNKPLTLIGARGGTLDAQGAGDVLIVTAPDCRIEGLVIRGSGDNLEQENTGISVLADRVVIQNNRFEDVLFGIDLKNADHCVIRNNHITSKPLDIARRGDALRLFRSHDCLIEDNVIENGRDALLWYSNRVVARGNISRHNRYGFHTMFANDATFENNVLSDNSVGIYLMYGKQFRISGNRFERSRGPSGYGLGLKEVDHYLIEGNVFAGNRVGTYIDGSPYTRKNRSATITRNVFACNDIGMTLLPAVRGNRIFENSFADNIEQIAVQGRGAVAGNEFAVAGRGNFWSDYGGYDANHDGIGDQPYASRKLFENLIDREPKLRLLLYSPAHDAIEFIGRALPAVRPEPKFTDAAPLMSPPIMSASVKGTTAGPMWITSLLLIAFAASVCGAAFGRLARSPGGGAMLAVVRGVK